MPHINILLDGRSIAIALMPISVLLTSKHQVTDFDNNLGFLQVGLLKSVSMLPSILKKNIIILNIGICM